MAKALSPGDGLRYLGKDKKSGLLRYQATLRKKSGGKLIVDTERVIRANSKAEALAAKDRILGELVQNKLGLRARSRKRLGEAIEEWLPQLPKGTRIAYGSHARSKLLQLGAARFLDEIDAQEIQRVIATAKVKDDTAAIIRGAAIALYEWARESGYVAKNIARDTVKRRTRKTGAQVLAEQAVKQPRKAMTVAELKRFLAVLKEQNPEVHVLAGTQFALGCRFGEVSALRWEDIDSATGVVQIRRAQMCGEMGPPKNKKRREAGLGRDALKALTEHRQRLAAEGRPGIDEWCFPVKPGVRRTRTDLLMGYQSVHGAFRKAMATCGIELGPATHALRHTMITLAELAKTAGAALVAERMAGVFGASKELQASVGHADPRMTAQYTEIPGSAYASFANSIEDHLRSDGGLKGRGNPDDGAQNA